jgi:AcrR family transcriptional regulator
MHKTKRALIDTVLQLLDGDPTVEVSMNEVLHASGITSGSLYYHFSDFPDLIDHALVEIFSNHTRAGIAGLAETIAQSQSGEEALASLAPLIDSRHQHGQAKARAALAWIAAQATLRPKLKEKLGPAQSEMTRKISVLIAEGQEKGLVRKELDPQVTAVFVQSYALGRIVDDLAGNEMDVEAWTRFIKQMVKESILSTS